MATQQSNTQISSLIINKVDSLATFNEMVEDSQVNENELYLVEGDGIPSGGTAGQVLAKRSSSDYDLEWITPSGGSSVTVDSALSSSSENPVQNKVIKSALDNKITAPSSPSSGQFLVYDGSAWTAMTLATWSGGSY